METTEEENIKNAMAKERSLIMEKLNLLEIVMYRRFDNLKKVIGDYLELSSNISIATVKANLKSV